MAHNASGDTVPDEEAIAWAKEWVTPLAGLPLAAE